MYSTMYDTHIISIYYLFEFCKRVSYYYHTINEGRKSIYIKSNVKR